MRRRAWMAGVVSATMTSLGCGPKADRPAREPFEPVRHLVRKPKPPISLARDGIGDHLDMDALRSDLRRAQAIDIFANSRLVREISAGLVDQQPNARSVRIRLQDRNIGSKARQELHHLKAIVHYPETPIVAPRFVVVLDQDVVWIGEQCADSESNSPSLGMCMRTSAPDAARAVSGWISSLQVDDSLVAIGSPGAVSVLLGSSSARRQICDAVQASTRSIDLLVDDVTHSDLADLLERCADRHVKVRILARHVSAVSSELTRFEKGRVGDIQLVLSGDTCSKKGDLAIIDQSTAFIPVDDRIDSRSNLMFSVSEPSMIRALQERMERCLRHASYTTANQLERAWR